ncbi:hypothetical protein JCM9140_4671 [Halalkalibacter wakoensis JCM 9140]|uniref:Uncharacterized protein n=1 Tax=Halalkalibacter wakoensis JCM 9140 TaxID=1236970 RepID=W4Q8T1_9BACI|nr:hypothetical protein [Halalkalibacter wakoensis]GAE28446.1 hypothetical protein JCM9140_4671 [Halalkalibacter wakoensis JCM 9140]
MDKQQEPLAQLRAKLHEKTTSCFDADNYEALREEERTGKTTKRNIVLMLS